MRVVRAICERELWGYLRTPMGYGVMLTVLLIDGILFNVWAIGDGHRRSAEALEVFFFVASGPTVVASVLLAMHLIADERQRGTLIILETAPLSGWQIVGGKFLAALTILGIIHLLSITMPALIYAYGRVSIMHIVMGYLGLTLLGAATLAIALCASAFAQTSLIAAITGGALVVVLVCLHGVAQLASPPMDSVLSYLSLIHEHYRPFMRGVLSIRAMAFYISLTLLALLVAARRMEWRT